MNSADVFLAIFRTATYLSYCYQIMWTFVIALRMDEVGLRLRLSAKYDRSRCRVDGRVRGREGQMEVEGRGRQADRQTDRQTGRQAGEPG
jgi:hypothetical protein